MYPRTTHSIGKWFGAADEHRAPRKGIGPPSELAGKIVRLDHVMRDDSSQFFEPETAKAG